MKTAATLFATAALLALGAPAAAQDRSFNMPAQPATKSIPEFARQAGLQIIAPTDHLSGITTPAITGRADARAALRELIANTGLVVASDRGGVIVLKRPGGGTEEGSTDADPATDPDIIVTGSRIAGDQRNSPNPVAVLEADTLVARSGSISIGDQLSLLPQFRTTGTQAASTPSGGHRFDLPPERTAKWRPGPHLACLYGFGPDGARQTFRRNLWVVIAAPDEAPSAEPAAMA